MTLSEEIKQVFLSFTSWTTPVSFLGEVIAILALLHALNLAYFSSKEVRTLCGVKLSRDES